MTLRRPHRRAEQDSERHESMSMDGLCSLPELATRIDPELALACQHQDSIYAIKHAPRSMKRNRERMAKQNREKATRREADLPGCMAMYLTRSDTSRPMAKSIVERASDNVGK